jgi:integrase
MASVYWQGQQWIAQWYRQDGSRVKRGTKEKKRRAAESIATEMETKDLREKSDSGRKYLEILDRATAEGRAGKLGMKQSEEYLLELRRVADPNYSTVTLAEWLERWRLEMKPRVSASTAGIHEDMIRHFKDALGTRVMAAALGELTRPQIKKAIARLKEGGLSGSSVNLSLRLLRQALRQAVADRIVPENAAEGIQPLPEEDSIERAPFTTEEVRKLIDQPKTTVEWQGMILFGAHTGLRLSDISKLTDDHLDGVDIVIRPKKTQKTKKTIRIPLTPPCLAWLATRKEPGPLFPVLSTKSAPALSGQFTSIMGRAKVAARVTLPGGIVASRSFHSLRHSFASWLAEADIHADVRKQLTGHTTEDTHAVYTHHDQTLRRAIQTLPDIRPAVRG